MLPSIYQIVVSMMKVLPFLALVGVASAFTAAGKTYLNHVLYVRSIINSLYDPFFKCL